MDTAIRWSPMSTTSQQRFLYIDVAGRSLKLCNVTSYDKSGLKYEVLSTNSKVPPFRAVDWSPVKEGLVAVGQSSGEATVLRIDDDSQDSFLLPIRNQRYCNAVAFNTEGLLATGLDKVRNDFCLNIWDLNQRLSMGTSRGFGADRHSVEPWRKLASSEPITSIKFFKDRPDTLVAGVKGQFVRIYDLREGPGNAALQFPTRCVHNLAIDWLDENYIASCYPSNDPMICIWDRRAGSRITSTPVTTLASTESGQLSSALDLKDAIDPKGPIWSLRFARTKRGCLGALSSTGHFKVFDIVKDYVSEEHRNSLDQTLGEGSAQNYPEQIYTKNIRDIKHPFHHPSRGSEESQRIVSFDFLNISSSGEPSAITLNGDGKVDILNLQPPHSPINLSSQSQLVRGDKHRDLDFKTLGPALKPGTNISQNVKDIQDRILMDTPLPATHKSREESRSNGESGLYPTIKDETTQIGSREIRERSLTAGTWGRMLSADEALTLMAVARLRCKEGYLFDGEKNKHIVSDDRCLQGFWDWLSRARLNSSDETMIFKGLDMNYLGVFGIWNNDLGQSARRGKLGANGNQTLDIPNIVKGLVYRLEIPEAKGCETDYPEHRRLCLRICGCIETDDHLENVVKELVSQRRHTKAAALAVFQDEARLAYLALRTNEPTQAHKLLAMAIAGASKGETDSDWEETCAEIAKELTDPYARAILALVSKGDWKEVIQEATLPLKYRVEVALRWLSDDDLSEYLLDATRDAIRQGDIEGVVLTGLGSAAMDLFQSYISKFNDVQTPVLAMSHTVPRFVTDSANQLRFEAWRETYRLQINSWKLHLDRARFDVMSRKFAVTWDGRRLTKPPPQQVSLICTYCTRPLAQNEASSPQSADASSFGSGGETTTHLTTGNPLGSATVSGTVCPKCGRHMPRCGVCSLWLGSTDPMAKNSSTTSGASGVDTGTGTGAAGTGTGTAQGEEGRKALEYDVMKRFAAFCIRCNHGFHADHAREWFQKHRICPVAECNCICDR